MLIYEYKLRASPAQQAAMDEAIRTAQFIRNKCLRLWMDERGISANDLQISCSRLAHEFDFAARLNSQARQAAASRAWQAIDRFYTNCREKRPGKKGYPRFRHDVRSVEYKTTGWALDAEGKHLTMTDGCGIGRMRLLGTRDLAAVPGEAIKRVRLLRRADGYYAQFVIQVTRHLEHLPTGKAVGIDMGLKVALADSNGAIIANPRLLHHVEARLKRHQRVLSRRSLHHQRGKKPAANHAARKRAKANKYPAATQPLSGPLPVSTLTPSGGQSRNWHKAKGRVAKEYLHLQRQREDFARKTASALVRSADLLALEDLRVRNLVRNRHLSKAISDISWGRLRRWVEYYGALHGIPVIAVPPQYTTQDCSRCGTRVRKSLSMRTHLCPKCRLVLDRDHNAALVILGEGLAIASRQGRWPRIGTVGHTGTERLGTVGLL